MIRLRQYPNGLGLKLKSLRLRGINKASFVLFFPRTGLGVINLLVEDICSYPLADTMTYLPPDMPNTLARRPFGRSGVRIKYGFPEGEKLRVHSTSSYPEGLYHHHRVYEVL